MTIFVINLPEAVKRRESITRQLEGLGLAYEVLSAVRGSSLSAAERDARMDGRAFQRNHGRPASAGELGCSLSHLAVYRTVVERGLSHALVLEDDAWLNPNLPAVLDALERKIPAEEPLAILLGWAKVTSKDVCVRIWSSYDLVRARSATLAHGYVITRTAAERLLAALYPVRRVADCWDWLARHRVVRLRALVPPCVTLDLSMESSLAPAIHALHIPLSPVRRYARKACRAWWLLADYVKAGCRSLAERK